MEIITINLNKEEDAYFSKEVLTSDILVGSVMEVFNEETNNFKAILYKKNGKPFSGELIIKYSSGDLFFNCLYKDGKQDGLETRYYPSNIIAKKILYKNNIENGDVYLYDIYGRLSSSYQNKDGQVDGYAQVYYPNGNIKEEGNLISIIIEESLIPLPIPINVGVWKYYYENGKLKEEGEWLGQMDGTSIPIGERFISRTFIERKKWRCRDCYRSDKKASSRRIFCPQVFSCF